MDIASLPPHVQANREYWSQMAGEWVEPGRKSWSKSEITWGIWGVAESKLEALGSLDRWRGRDVVELGCGVAYFSAWMARLGAYPVGIDITPSQLESARSFQQEFGIQFPLIEASAEAVPLPSDSFDLAISEYGASIWCDPYQWVKEAARLLRPEGLLVFLRNSTLATLCTGQSGPASEHLQRDYFGIHRLEWDDTPGIEFHLTTGPMLDCLRMNGFELERLIEIAPPAEATENRFEYVSLEWSRRWPSEELWVARKKHHRIE